MTLTLLISICGCGLTAEEAQELYDDFVFENQSCDEAADCTYVNATPSKGCRIDTVNTASRDEALNYAQELLGDLRTSDASIQEYGCLEPDEAPVCTDGRCAFPDDAASQG